jgi:hypothetical protein
VREGDRRQVAQRSGIVIATTALGSMLESSEESSAREHATQVRTGSVAQSTARSGTTSLSHPSTECVNESCDPRVGGVTAQHDGVAPFPRARPTRSTQATRRTMPAPIPIGWRRHSR